MREGAAAAATAVAATKAAQFGVPYGVEQELSKRSQAAAATAAAATASASAQDLESCAPLLVGAESYEWAAMSNLDVFFARVYRYWHGRGLIPIIVSGLLNIAVLAFTIAFSGFLLIFVNWGALHAECVQQDSCDITSVALYSHPFGNRGIASDVMIGIYIIIFGVYWFWTLSHFAWELRCLAEVKHFMNNKLGVSERQVSMMTWAEVVHKVVIIQRSTRLSISRDLNEHDIVSRIMRKDNYLIALVNTGLLRLAMPRLFGRGAANGQAGGGGSSKKQAKQQRMTKTLEWNLRWCILDPMFDESFCLKRGIFSDVAKLKTRLRRAALVNAVLSPFLLLFLIIYFFMHNAERFYSHPGSIGSRRWSPLATWMLREYNELPHYTDNRLNASHEAALKYIGQFPSHTVASVARFVAFVTGSFAALLLLMTILDENLLERDLLGRHVVWWLATMGVLLTASRALVSEDPVAYNPELAMYEVVKHTHYLPRSWRGRAHTTEVQDAFNRLFKPKVALFFEEIASVVLTPFMLAFSLPACAEEIAEFLRESTVHVEGVGDVCNLSTFDLEHYGSTKYGAPAQKKKGGGVEGGGGGGGGGSGAAAGGDHERLLSHQKASSSGGGGGGNDKGVARDRQGKVEKSLLTFVATYPTWEPPPAGRAMLHTLSRQAAHARPYLGPGCDSGVAPYYYYRPGQEWSDQAYGLSQGPWASYDRHLHVPPPPSGAPLPMPYATPPFSHPTQPQQALGASSNAHQLAPYKPTSSPVAGIHSATTHHPHASYPASYLRGGLAHDSSASNSAPHQWVLVNDSGNPGPYLGASAQQLHAGNEAPGPFQPLPQDSASHATHVRYEVGYGGNGSYSGYFPLQPSLQDSASHATPHGSGGGYGGYNPLPPLPRDTASHAAPHGSGSGYGGHNQLQLLNNGSRGDGGSHASSAPRGAYGRYDPHASEARGTHGSSGGGYDPPQARVPGSSAHFSDPLLGTWESDVHRFDSCHPQPSDPAQGAHEPLPTYDPCRPHPPDDGYADPHGASSMVIVDSPPQGRGGEGGGGGLGGGGGGDPDAGGVHLEFTFSSCEDDPPPDGTSLSSPQVHVGGINIPYWEGPLQEGSTQGLQELGRYLKPGLEGDPGPSVAPKPWGSQVSRLRSQAVHSGPCSGIGSISYGDVRRGDCTASFLSEPEDVPLHQAPLEVPPPHGHAHHVHHSYRGHGPDPHPTYAALRPPPPCAAQGSPGPHAVHTAVQISDEGFAATGSSTAELYGSVFGLNASNAAQGPGGVYDSLPRNETLDLQLRLVAGHELLQSLYEEREVTVQQRRIQAAAERSISHSRMSRR